MDNILDNILKLDTLELLKYTYNNSPEEFIKNMNMKTKDGYPYLYSFLMRVNGQEQQINCYDFFESIGYDIKTKTSIYKINKNDSEEISEYEALSHMNITDEAFNHITKKLGKEYITDMAEELKEKIIKNSFKFDRYETAKTYFDYGLDFDFENQSNKSIFQIAERNAKMLGLYWKCKALKENVSIENKKVDAYEFEKDINWVVKKIEYIYDKYDEYKSKEALEYMENKWDFYSQDQKEKMLLASFKTSTKTTSAGVYKLLGINKLKYESVNNPEWLSLDKIKHQQIFYDLCKKGITFKERVGEDLAIDKLISFIAQNNYKINRSSTMQKVTDTTIESKINERINDDFFLSEVPNENYNFFTHIIKFTKKPSNAIFQGTISKNIENVITLLSSVNEDNTEYVKNYINKTWFLENAGELNLDNIVKNNEFYSEYFLDKKLLEKVYTTDQLESIFNIMYDTKRDLIKIGSSRINSNFVNLYEEMKKRQDINWDNIQLNNDKYEDLEITYEIKVFKEYLKLKKEIPINKENTKKAKI